MLINVNAEVQAQSSLLTRDEQDETGHHLHCVGDDVPQGQITPRIGLRPVMIPLFAPPAINDTPPGALQPEGNHTTTNTQPI